MVTSPFFKRSSGHLCYVLAEEDRTLVSGDVDCRQGPLPPVQRDASVVRSLGASPDLESHLISALTLPRFYDIIMRCIDRFEYDYSPTAEQYSIGAVVDVSQSLVVARVPQFFSVPLELSYWSCDAFSHRTTRLNNGWTRYVRLICRAENNKLGYLYLALNFPTSTTKFLLRARPLPNNMSSFVFIRGYPRHIISSANSRRQATQIIMRLQFS